MAKSRKTITNEEVSVTHGSGNVFADLGFANAEELQVKAGLTHQFSTGHFFQRLNSNIERPRNRGVFTQQVLKQVQSELEHTELPAVAPRDPTAPPVLRTQRTERDEPDVGEAGRHQSTRKTRGGCQMRFMQMAATTFLVGDKGGNTKTFCLPATRLVGRLPMREQSQRGVRAFGPATEQPPRAIGFCRHAHIVQRAQGPGGRHAATVSHRKRSPAHSTVLGRPVRPT